MPWPPTTPSGTRTKDTGPAGTLHATDHNQLKAALDDVVTKIDTTGVPILADTDVRVRRNGTKTLSFDDGSGGSIGLDFGRIRYAPAPNGTDDRTTLQALVDSLAAAGGGVLEVPSLPYKLGSSLNLKDKVSVKGGGKNATTFELQAGLTTAGFLGASGDTVSDITLSGFALLGNRSAFATNVRGLQVTNGARVKVDEVRCEDVRDVAVLLTNCPDSKIYDSDFISCGKGGTVGHTINVDGGSDRVRILNCTIMKNGEVGDTGFGIRLDDVDDGRIEGNYVEQATVVSTTMADRSLEPIGYTSTCLRTKVIGNICLRGGDNGISVSGPFSIVQGNHVGYACNIGISVAGTADDSTISGNTVWNSSQRSDAASSGITYASGYTGGTCTGNRCYDDQGTKTQDYGINAATGSAQLVIVGNDVRGNLIAGVNSVGTTNVVADNLDFTAVPTIAAGAGAGTGPTVSIGSGSTDLRGRVLVTTGTTPTAAGIIATISFNTTKGQAPKAVLLTASNPNAATTITRVYTGNFTTTGFDIVNNATAMSASLAFDWWFEVIW